MPLPFHTNLSAICVQVISMIVIQHYNEVLLFTRTSGYPVIFQYSSWFRQTAAQCCGMLMFT